MKRMPKLFTRSVFLALSMVLILAMVASASPMLASTTKSLSTNYTLVNLGAQEANVVAQYWKEDGSRLRSLNLRSPSNPSYA
jgi:hypothetical protein